MSLSIRAYARRRKAKGLTGGTHRAVQAAIADGRLTTSLTANGKQIADPDLADAEWAASTHSDRVPLTGPTSQKDRPPDKAPTPSPLLDARTRREQIRVQRDEFELARDQGKYILVDEARADVIAAFSLVKTRLLGVPSKLAQRWPRGNVDLEVVALADELIREALEELSDRRAPGQVNHKETSE